MKTRDLACFACVAIALSVACDKDKPPQSTPTTDGAPSVAIASNASAAGSPHADAGGAGDSFVSLLAWTDSRVAVSSTVDNPRDFPEHLIDGNKETAWNGKTGDLAGGFIAFRVPEQASVREIQITAGFDHIAKDGTDLFTANHRIARVRITRDGAVVKEATLDTARRELQSIPIDGPGGTYKIEVLATAPGSKAAWKELVVSELQVLGDPRAARTPGPHMPRVRVGSLDGDALDGGITRTQIAVTHTIDAYCKQFMHTNEAAVRTTWEDPRHPCQDPNARATCDSSVERAFTKTGKFSGILVVDTADAETETRLFAVTIPNGSYVTFGSSAHGRCELGDPGSESFDVLSAKEQATADGAALVAIETKHSTMAPTYPQFGLDVHATRALVVCRATADAVTCDAPRTLGKFDGEVGANGNIPPFNEWSERASYTIGDDGVVVMHAVR